jgi:glycerol-1-phosphate dehydrogenase [NAD(P)+]
MVTKMDETLINREISAFAAKGITTVYGIGGGSACDFAKIASQELRAQLLLVPSILSVDAPFTRAAGVRVVEGGRTSVRYVGDASTRLRHLVVDSDLLSRAPRILNTAGVGDIISIVTALWDWRAACERQGEPYCSDTAKKSLAVVNRFMDTDTTTAGLLASGAEEAYTVLAECFAEEVRLCESWGNSRPEEGSEHYLAYHIESVTGRGFIHGKLVGLCVLVVHLLQHLASGAKSEAKEGENGYARALVDCKGAARLASFYSQIGLECAPGSPGMPSMEELKKALHSMDSFLLVEKHLLPGYFHFFGAPNAALTEAVCAHVKILLGAR